MQNDRSIPNLSFRLPKHNSAIIKLTREVKRGFEALDPILGQIKTLPVVHGGLTRQVSEPAILDTPMREYSVDVQIDPKWFENTDVDSLGDFLWNLTQSTISDSTKHLFEIVSQTCDASGNTLSAAGRNFWDSYIEMLETTKMSFNEDGTHNFKLYGHPDRQKEIEAIPRSPEQEARINRILEDKRKEFYAQKRSRRLS